MIKIGTLLWDKNHHSQPFSRVYDETWVEKLYRGFERNLTQPFEFSLLTDRERKFTQTGINQIVDPSLGQNGYSDCIKAYSLDGPLILCGLDTIVCGNVDHLADYCIRGGTFALPRDPYHPEIACNGVSLCPEKVGLEIFTKHTGLNDMEHVRSFPHVFLDDIFPGHVVSYKGTVKKAGIGDARIIYFHGMEKPQEFPKNSPVRRHWV